MEIDLLRAGERTVTCLSLPDCDYVTYLSRASRPRTICLWPSYIRDRLPVVGVPLRGDDPDIPLDLQAVVDKLIESGSYDTDAEYHLDPVPPLKPEDAEWARAMIAEKTANGTMTL